MRKSLLFLVLVLLASCANEQAKKETVPGEYTLLSAGAFHVKSQAMPEAIILDVRSAKEVALGKIEGAVTKNYFDKDFSDFLSKLDKEKPVFIYSQFGQQSSKAAAVMIRNGFRTVMDLQGGFEAWKQLPFHSRQTEAARG